MLPLGVAALPDAPTSATPQPRPVPKSISKPVIDNSQLPSLQYRSLSGKWISNSNEPIQLKQNGNYVGWYCRHPEANTKKLDYLFQGQIKGTLLEGDFVQVTLDQNPTSGHVVFKLDGPKRIRLKSSTGEFPTQTLEKVEDENTSIPIGQRCISIDDAMLNSFQERLKLSRKKSKR
jgi:hypothetical protein